LEKTILIVSDLHLGAGETLAGQKNQLEDFHFDEKFADFLPWKVNQTPYLLELLILGDAFDFPQVLPEIGLTCDDWRLGTTQEESRRRLEMIIQGHGIFFQALKDFLSAGHTVRFLRGNHDIDLFWPDVQARLRREIGGGNNLIFEDSHIYRYMGLYCEHGNQYSVENAFSNPYRPVKTDSSGMTRLERCWGTYFMDVVYNDIETRFPVIDNVEDGQVIRGALMAIKSARIHFTGKVVGRMFKIARWAGFPVFGWTVSWILGEESDDLPPKEELPSGRIATAEDFLKNLRDPEISENLLRRYKDEADFRAQFDSEIDEVVQEQVEKEVHLLPKEDVNRTMGLITGKSAYQRAAEKIIKKEAGVKFVVFGHTHSAVDGNFESLSDEGIGKYFNSGSWTYFVDLDNPLNKGKSFDELCDSGIRKSTLDFVEVTFTTDGSIHATLGSA
jgi:UDP-2,3-diacylglucosamine pyrophosphatase LpxH